jgi:hypothetical protein
MKHTGNCHNNRSQYSHKQKLNNYIIQKAFFENQNRLFLL